MFDSISIVRASDRTFRVGVFDTLEGTMVGCLLGEPIIRCPVLPGPATPRRLAVCRRDPTGSCYIRVLDSTYARHFRKYERVIDFSRSKIEDERFFYFR